MEQGDNDAQLLLKGATMRNYYSQKNFIMILFADKRATLVGWLETVKRNEKNEHIIGA